MEVFWEHLVLFRVKTFDISIKVKSEHNNITCVSINDESIVQEELLICFITIVDINLVSNFDVIGRFYYEAIFVFIVHPVGCNSVWFALMIEHVGKGDYALLLLAVDSETILTTQ